MNRTTACRSRRVFFASALALVLILGVSPALSAQPAVLDGASLLEDDGPGHLESSTAEALRIGARFYAQDYGVDEKEAMRRLLVQEELSGVLPLLRSAAGERLAGLWIEHEPEYRIVVRLAGTEPVPDGFQTAVQDSPLPVVFETGALVTKQELLTLVDSVTERLMATIPGLMGIDIDVKTGEIVLFVYNEGGLKAATGLQLLKIQDELGQAMRIEELNAPMEDGHTRGGAALSTCTSGFVVESGSTPNGFVTAGHCGDTQTYFEYGGTSYAATFQSEIRDANQDVQWHTTSHTEYPHFYASSTSSYRTVTGLKNRSDQAAGNYVCHRGKTSGYSCGNIQSTSYKPTYTNACNGVTCSSVWIRVTGASLACAGGDSGGPWFNSTTAYGTHKAGSSSGTGQGDCSEAIYMAINYITGLGVSLSF